VSSLDVVLSLIMFIGLYAILLVLFLYLLNAKIQQGPEPLETVETTEVSALPDTFRDIFSRRGRAG
jgi:cytochrome bd-type quinol oxidase subunit 1